MKEQETDAGKMHHNSPQPFFTQAGGIPSPPLS